MKTPRGKLVTLAYIVAFVAAAIEFINLASGQLSGLFFPVFLCAGIGILRRRAWSAFGLALVITAQFLILVISLLRAAGLEASKGLFVAGLVLGSILIGLFFFTGRSLAATDAPRGSALPWVILAVLLLLPFVFLQPFVIPTGSMEDTILIGDHIWVLRLPLTLPKRGDLTVFRNPTDRRQVLVKRVIGVAGDRIKIVGKRVYRNGGPLYEPYTKHNSDYMDPYRDNFPSEPNGPLYPPAVSMLKDSVRDGEVVVPSGSYFVLGDNRDSSLDSRYWGFIEPGDVLGKPLIILYSEERTTEEIGGDEPSVPVHSHMRWERLLKRL